VTDARLGESEAAVRREHSVDLAEDPLRVREVMESVEDHGEVEVLIGRVDAPARVELEFDSGVRGEGEIALGHLPGEHESFGCDVHSDDLGPHAREQGRGPAAAAAEIENAASRLEPERRGDEPKTPQRAGIRGTVGQGAVEPVLAARSVLEVAPGALVDGVDLFGRKVLERRRSPREKTRQGAQMRRPEGMEGAPRHPVGLQTGDEGREVGSQRDSQSAPQRRLQCRFAPAARSTALARRD
jgi:hypothetical protein